MLPAMKPAVGCHGLSGGKKYFRNLFIDRNPAQRRLELTGIKDGNALKIRGRVIRPQNNDPVKRKTGSQLERIRTDPAGIHVPGMGNHQRHRLFHIGDHGLAHHGIDIRGKPAGVIRIEFARDNRRTDKRALLGACR